jgi:FkbM family methyltransferase
MLRGYSVILKYCRVMIDKQAFPSYSQAGEDRILHFLFELLGSTSGLLYADLGAAFPVGGNNTYLFYTLGGSGVLVEADPAYLPEYQQMRPRDRVERVAIVPKRLRSLAAVPFHIARDPGWSSISDEHTRVALALGKGPITNTLTVPCLTINELLSKHFPDGRIDIISMDLEGVDGEVLAELDIDHFRPRAIVVERGSGLPSQQELLAAGYELFASTFVNSIFADSICLQKMRF